MSLIAPHIDHTLLKQDATKTEVAQLCADALRYGFASVCIPPSYVRFASEQLRGSNVKTCTVIGFPLGYSTMVCKLAELEEAIANGAQEADMVINLAALKSGNLPYVEAEIAAATETAHAAGAVIKVIVESGILDHNELQIACAIVARIKPDFIKTSTGFAEKGASAEAVTFMRANLPQEIDIKASGGIRTFAAAEALLKAGATRIGCSASLNILKEEKSAGVH